ncbi:HPr family phosphocarrier protein [Microbacterium paludicola]|uniref:Phosphocarrier protein HPr n=1 Tax=Microbacterium paludicola TaxID=300019 RepID=A0A4Y9FUE4_9MICO|nr:dihydroxyacetone kinase phosphoryl donor subunit DhaM [Microbacterium paludicola]MBF0817153.1 HPr family phosphocarrier protein [Microbacterium paludicola]TFU32144.1 HPr family phosphocarrier protein [Microbacterium paludicola]
MIGLVIVSHSEPLAQATVDLARQMAQGEHPPIRIAAGAEGGFGTDAAAIAAALDELADTDGVLVMTDLGSAALSTDLALDLRESTQPVRISDGPLVEGTTAALVRAATGGTLDEVAAEAANALAAKRRDEDEPAAAPPEPEAPTAPDEAAAGSQPEASAEVELINPLGIHSRPAAVLARTAAGYDADIRISNVTEGRGPVNAASLVGLLSLAGAKGHVLRIEATGPDHLVAVEELRRTIADGLGEV